MSATRAPALRDAAIGFCGKIPARGDFVRSGLPREFAEPWDSWMQRMLAASHSALGEAWLPAWLEAPVWRFALSPGICGPAAVIGLWMPSVDSIGRYFPLTIAAVAGHSDIRDAMREGERFLAALEDAGRDALDHELTPGDLTARLTAAASAIAVGLDADLTLRGQEGGLWWTSGAPRVPARRFESPGLPDEITFIAMVDPCTSVSLPARPQSMR